MSATGNETNDDQVPAWARRTAGESRWAATAAIVGILIVQFYLPSQFIAGPRWVVPGIGLLLLIVLMIGSPIRLDREEIRLRRFSLLLMALLGFAMVWSVYHLVRALINGSVSDNPAGLLTSGGAIWLTNLLVFALWYWDFDRGGPAARAHARKPYPDFLWVQMQNPDLTDPEWEPEFPDYLYLSFTNATAFSPTDVMPMSRWAKTMMMVQSGISLITVSLVIARAVNVLR
ncbi:DUF1345 domain-containing protein [Nocardia aurantiaca]|uniref:DUF1345 domain-containing protein n=1 Tax=Nocardia aurantiaca TaxID=2675850 RepID=A0A6I3L7G5_9NOCA|nr:DUF1345 domain-containing protein [Nocardia aurantiaca]MTE16455.1 DUF1345 domain-containing protein [Nocardia aurantiaca]